MTRNATSCSMGTSLFSCFSVFPFVRLPFCSKSLQLSDFLIRSSLRLVNVQDLAQNDLPTTMNARASSSFNLSVFRFDWRMLVSAREAGGTMVSHKNGNKIRRLRGVLPPFCQSHFLFRFIPPLLGCFCIRDSTLIIF